MFEVTVMTASIRVPSKARQVYDQAREDIDSHLYLQNLEEIKCVLEKSQLSQFWSIASYNQASAFRYAQQCRPEVFGWCPVPESATLSSKDIKILEELDQR